MRSLKFPKMFNSNNTNVWKETEHKKATAQNTKLLLHSTRGDLLGDPYFGLMLKRYMFEPNNYVLQDIIIDMIYTQLVIFIPQLFIKRKDIEIIQDRVNGRGTLICNFHAINQVDYSNDMYSLVLFQDAE